MLSHTDLKKGTQFILQGQPCEVLESSLNFRGRGSSVMQTKIKNLISGNITPQTFRQADTFEEAEITKIALEFVYANRGKFVFAKASNKSKRIELSEAQIGEGTKFLKANQEVVGLNFQGRIINVVLPVKVELKVTEAPPGIKAGRAEAGTKQVTLESGAKINAPLFIKQGDIVEVNTDTVEYVRRVE